STRCTHTNLRDYLQLDGNRQFVWQKLLEVALELKYLHERRIVLDYISCEHILVGTDGAAKTNGSGIELQEYYAGKGMGGTRWRLSECLRGEAPSVMSNIHSLAVCIYESMTGEAPWNDKPDYEASLLVRGVTRPKFLEEYGYPVEDLTKKCSV
uniref:Protein kinase domain-containing protein n=1 Tax=Globisporangium ultimum (strain ATCC 200006 / CBS 805.95 / DAOM BR144) TaxID=431595 RepID=K3WRJ2_GLOUD